MKTYFTFAFWLIAALPDVFAQKITVEEYIDTYKELAIAEMKRSGIPASITLAQGILESANGNSRLAVVASNHFGIKCHGWEGKEIYHDDNAKDECFRHYKSAKESYIDHTDFLMTRSRYAFLFEYKSTDYKNWAKGLRKAGYATDPKYPQRLIALIERYDLQQFDTGVKPERKPAATTPSDTWDEASSFNIEQRPVKVNNHTEYIVARQGDTYTSLSNELSLMEWQLPKYNESNATDELKERQVVYVQPKRRKAERGKDMHRVNDGETMHYIAQKYAIKLARLYKLNRMKAGTQPEAGDMVNLRKKKKKNK